MKRIVLGVVAATLLAGGAALANVFDVTGTAWTCASAEKSSVKGLGSAPSAHVDIALSFGAGTWSLTHPEWGNYTGTWTAAGKSGFKAVMDAGAVAAFSDYMETQTMAAIGASSVSVDALKHKIKGKVMPTGLLVVKFMAKGTGSATIDGRTRKGWSKTKAVLTGLQN